MCSARIIIVEQKSRWTNFEECNACSSYKAKLRGAGDRFDDYLFRSSGGNQTCSFLIHATNVFSVFEAEWDPLLNDTA